MGGPGHDTGALDPSGRTYPASAPAAPSPAVALGPEIDPDLWVAVLDDVSHPGEAIAATLNRLAQRAARALQASSAIFLLTADGKLRPAAFWDDDPGRLADLAQLFARGAAALGEGPLGRTMQSGEPVLITTGDEDATSAPGSVYAGFSEDAGLDSFILTPMIGTDGPVGVLGVGRYSTQRRLEDSAFPVAARIAQAATQVVRVASLVQRGKVADLALSAMRDAVIALDTNGVITSWNRGAAHLYGFAEVDAVGQRFSGLVPSEVLDGNAALFDPNHLDWELPAGQPWMGRLSQDRREGSKLVVESVISPIHDAHGTQQGVVIVNRDISSMIEIGSALRQKELLAQTALDASPLILGVFDNDGSLLACSRGWRELVGLTHGVGTSVHGFADDVLSTPQDKRRLLESFTRVLAGAANIHHDFEILSEEGKTRTLAVWVSRVHGVGVTITIADVSDRARRERELAYSANHDATTGLPNRGALFSRAKHAVRRAVRRETPVAVLFCDLDGFKQLNDQFGHGAGDDLLTAFGARLLESCRASDTVARIGGDEFAVLLEDDVTEESLAAVAQRIVTAAATPFDIPAGQVAVTASVGAVLAQVTPEVVDAAQEVENLIDRADVAMYHAKSLGKNRWSRFNEALERTMTRRGDAHADIEAGAEAGQFHVHYQPQFGRCGELVGAEALLRWHDPQRGVVDMSEVIAELGGIPAGVADTGVAEAIADLARWRGMLPLGFRLSLNLSREQWLDPVTTDRLLQLAETNGVPGSLLRLEIDPDALGVDPEMSAAATRRLSATGIEIAINGLDFADSGLLAARRFEIGCMILGGRLVREAEQGGGTLISALVALGRQLGWKVLATGVETDEQLEAVRSAGCSAAQGFVLGHPLNAGGFAREYLPGTPAPVAAD